MFKKKKAGTVKEMSRNGSIVATNGILCWNQKKLNQTLCTPSACLGERKVIPAVQYGCGSLMLWG